MEEISGLDKDSAGRHLCHMVDLFLFSLVPGLAFIPAHTLILGDLKDQPQYPGTHGLFDRPPPIGIWNIFHIVMKQGGCQNLVTGTETSEDADNTNQVTDVGDATLVQGIPSGLTWRSFNPPLTKLVKMTPRCQAGRALE